jgi:hypothetical protein
METEEIVKQQIAEFESQSGCKATPKIEKFFRDHVEFLKRAALKPLPPGVTRPDKSTRVFGGTRGRRRPSDPSKQA